MTIQINGIEVNGILMELYFATIENLQKCSKYATIVDIITTVKANQEALQATHEAYQKEAKGEKMAKLKACHTKTETETD